MQPHICKLCEKSFMKTGANPSQFCSDTCRFWSKVDKTPGLGPNRDCWEWVGGGNLNTTNKKYFQFSIKNKLILVYRVSWLLANNQEPPENLMVCHHCDNRKCVRPNHLFLGTQKDNIHDMIKKGRHFSKLSKLNVVVIRKLNAIDSKKYTIAYLATVFKVNRKTISKVVNNKTWIIHFE